MPPPMPTGAWAPGASPQPTGSWGPTASSTAAWPSPTGNASYLKFESEIFEPKLGQETKNQYDGGKGEARKVFIRGYLLSKVPVMGHVLMWFEGHGAADVTTEGLYSLTNFLDEDPFVINHLVWAFPSTSI